MDESDRSSINVDKNSALQINGETYYQLDVIKPITIRNSKQSDGTQIFIRKNHLQKRQVKNPFMVAKSNPIMSDLFFQLDDNSLVINSVGLHNAGNYLCFANSTRGYNYKTIHLNVVQPPGN